MAAKMPRHSLLNIHDQPRQMNWPRATALAIALVAVATLPAMAMAGIVPDDSDDPSVGAWSSHCSPTQYAAYDPITHRDSSPTHTHEFFAPIAMSPTTTPRDLRSQAGVQCNSASPPVAIQGGCRVSSGTTEVCDKSAYWAPELVQTDANQQNSVRISPAYALTYFRNEYLGPTAINSFDKELSMVAGDQAATGAQPAYIVIWGCVVGAHQYYRDDGRRSLMPDSCDLTATQRANKQDLFLRMVVAFPNCIVPGGVEPNGLEVPDSVHYAEADGHPGPQRGGPPYDSCPTSFTAIPTLQVGVRWKLNTQLTHTGPDNGTWTFDLTRLWLVSDLSVKRSVPGLERGTTAHADFMSGWTQSDINGLIDQCFHAAQLNCGYVGGNGT